MKSKVTIQVIDEATEKLYQMSIELGKLLKLMYVNVCYSLATYHRPKGLLWS